VKRVILDIKPIIIEQGWAKPEKMKREVKQILPCFQNYMLIKTCRRHCRC